MVSTTTGLGSGPVIMTVDAVGGGVEGGGEMLEPGPAVEPSIRILSRRRSSISITFLMIALTWRSLASFHWIPRLRWTSSRTLSGNPPRYSAQALYCMIL